MKHLNTPFDDAEYRKLKRGKGKRSWHDFVMEMADGSGIWVILDPDIKTWLLENVEDGQRSRWIEDAIKMKRDMKWA